MFKWFVRFLVTGLLCVSFADFAYSNTDVEKYYATWELKHSGKYRLAWYYNTEANFKKNQPNKVLVHNREFIVRPDVRPPTINGLYLLEHSKVNEGEEVLDIGTGTGVHAIFAADKAKRVVATDIYEPAIVNAKTNAKLLGVEDKIDFRVGDLFEPLKEGEKFDVFFININFPFNVNDEPRKKFHDRIFSHIKKYMKPGARIYFQTSFVKSLPYIYEMLSRYGLHIKEIHMEYFPEFKHEPLFLMVQSN